MFTFKVALIKNAKRNLHEGTLVEAGCVEISVQPVLRFVSQRLLGGLLSETVNHVAPGKMIVNVKNMCCVGNSKLSIAFDQHQVLVIIIRRFVTEIVTSRCYEAILRKRIDDQNLIVNNSEACAQKL